MLVISHHLPQKLFQIKVFQFTNKIMFVLLEMLVILNATLLFPLTNLVLTYCERQLETHKYYVI